MNIITKFSLGDRVYWINRERKHSWEKCEHCEDGFLRTKKGNSVKCSFCSYDENHYGYIYTHTKEAYRISQHYPILTIGQVRCEISKDKKEVSYMCNESGVGTGSAFYQKDLFLSEENAQKECDKRNK